MMKLKAKTSKDVELFNYLVGDFTENLVRIKLTSSLKLGNIIRYGHDPFYAPNLIKENGEMPMNLDLIEIDLASGNAKAIYEVKSATGNERSFKINGKCGENMKLALERNIPIYLAVVRLGRELDKNVLKTDLKTNTTYVDEAVYNSELEYFIHNAKVEIYKYGDFIMNAGKFESTGNFEYL